METLHDRFEACRCRIGLAPLPCDLYSDAAIAIRFSIAGKEIIFLGDHRRPNGAYIEHAVDRALQIYAGLPAAPDLLRIDDCPDLTIPGLPAPAERRGNSCYWTLPKEPPFLTRLLREIIRAELDPAGVDDLTDNVYFMSTETDVLFHLYDDRTADVAAADPEALRSLYYACTGWIVDEVQP